VLGTSAAGGLGGGGGTVDGEPRSTDAVIAARSGDVLLKHTLLKSDHFPGEHVGGSGTEGACGEDEGGGVGFPRSRTRAAQCVVGQLSQFAARQFLSGGGGGDFRPP
jgi:hypothetical protein